MCRGTGPQTVPPNWQTVDLAGIDHQGERTAGKTAFAQAANVQRATAAPRLAAGGGGGDVAAKGARGATGATGRCLPSRSRCRRRGRRHRCRCRARQRSCSGCSRSSRHLYRRHRRGGG